MMEDMFKTRRGKYQLDTATGLFTVKDKRSTPKIFLGSVDPHWRVNTSSRETEVLETVIASYRAVAVLLNFADGKAAGFTPEFRVGYRPFGIVCAENDILFVGEGKLSFSEGMNRSIGHNPHLKMELGSKIEKVYRQLRDEERNYPVQR